MSCVFTRSSSLLRWIKKKRFMGFKNHSIFFKFTFYTASQFAWILKKKLQASFRLQIQILTDPTRHMVQLSVCLTEGGWRRDPLTHVLPLCSGFYHMVAYNKVHQVIWFDSVVEPSTNTQYKAALFTPADVCFCEVSYYPTYAFRGIIKMPDSSSQKYALGNHIYIKL